MALIRWNPAHELTSLPSDVLNIQREINRMFDTFFRGEQGEDASLFSQTWRPAVDIVERENEYVAKVELPGVSKNDVKITMQDNVLTIRGEKQQEKKDKETNFHRVERFYGSFQRSFTMPTSVRSDQIDAEYTDGILTIRMPKAEEAKPKQIEVKVK